MKRLRLLYSNAVSIFPSPIADCRIISDTDRIKAYIDNHSPESAVIGGGYIGLEMAENLMARGVKTTIIEMLDQLMAPLDYEMAALVQDHIKDKGVPFSSSKTVQQRLPGKATVPLCPPVEAGRLNVT